MERVPWRPDLCIFGCLEADMSSTSGGETLLCDGVLVLEKMRPETREFLENHSLRYREETTKEDCERWIGVKNPTQEDMDRAKRDDFFEFNIEGGQYFKDYYVPAIRKPVLSDDLALANFIIFARYFNNTREFPTLHDGSEIPESLCQELKALCDSLAIEHTWQNDDILVFDNTRFQHGRHPIPDPLHRKIVTQFGYAGFADFTEAELALRPWRTAACWGAQESTGALLPTLPGHDVFRKVFTRLARGFGPRE